ncbi:glycoside hydrolase family 16 protein [Diplocarpon rosae]|nr:glycoside hydrolase family 16 protein [Diplocarpon rosae]
MYITKALGFLPFAGTTTALATNLTGTYLTYVASNYWLVDTYNSNNFFSDFSFFTGADPTHGYVNYQSQASAASAGLINTNNGQIYIGVDHTTVNPPSPGRASVRVSSTKPYTHGLFVADIAHMPGSICGVWPAFWLFGPNWPSSGEIDIIEGVNIQSTNIITLHTSAGCSINMAGSQSGTVLGSSDCNYDNANGGCSVSTSTANAYGSAFNSNGGGVYAMQWESSGIYVWFFPRGRIPRDITDGAPVTGNWGTPVVAFNGGSGCEIDSHFANQNIVFDTTFCGDWAGAVWGSGSCAGLGSCKSYVGANPGAFAPAYWSINSVKVYQQ